jgi:hypothetical protein
MAARRCINDFSTPFSANVRTGPETNIGYYSFELKLAYSAAWPQRMLMLIFNTSWRYAAHSLSEE